MKGLFLGSKNLGLRVLHCLRTSAPHVNWAIVHPHDLSDSRSILEQFDHYSRHNQLKLLIASSRAAAREFVFDFCPDVIFVCCWYWLVDSNILSRPPVGVFGIHPSLLPKYRGGSPLVWSIINGDPEVGATVFRLSEGMDDGDILVQVRVVNGMDDTIATILQKIENALVDKLPVYWRKVLNASAELMPQDEASASYCGQRFPCDGLIDWGKPAKEVHNFVRAQTTPYPGAYSFLDRRKIRILRTKLDQRVYYGTPGQVLFRGETSVTVACGYATAISICEVAIDGIQQAPGAIIRSISNRFMPRPAA
jgi:methionyl-tRNA formyltransferase